MGKGWGWLAKQGHVCGVARWGPGFSTWLCRPQTSSARRPSSAPSWWPPAPPRSGGSGRSWLLAPVLPPPSAGTCNNAERQETATSPDPRCGKLENGFPQWHVVNKNPSIFLYHIKEILQFYINTQIISVSTLDLWPWCFSVLILFQRFSFCSVPRQPSQETLVLLIAI